MKVFDLKEADLYDSSIVRKVPDYRELIATSTQTLTAQLPQNARLLVVGAGTGAEIFSIGEKRPDINFVAVDPAAPMIDKLLEKNKTRTKPLNIEIHVTGIEDALTEPKCDAALCFLVLHFFEAPQKLKMLKAIQKNLKPAGQLMSFDFMDFPANEIIQETKALVQWYEGQGMSTEEKDQIFLGYKTRFNPITQSEYLKLAGDAGFESAGIHFQRPRFLGFKLTARH